MLNSRGALRALLSAVAIVLALPVLAQAEAGGEGREFGRGGMHRGERRGPDPGRFVDRHGAELGLDAETRTSIQAIVETSRAQADQSRAEIQAEHESMRALLSQSSPDERAVMSQNDRIEALKSQRRRNRLEAMLAIRKLLSPEQREKLVGIQEAERAGRAERGEGRHFKDDAEPGAGHPNRGGGQSNRNGRRGPRAGCRADVAALCSEAASGRARLRCLDAHWDDLSEDCRSAFEDRRGRRDRPIGPVSE